MAATAEGCALELPSTCADARFPVQNARQIPSLASNRAEPVFSGQTLPPPSASRALERTPANFKAPARARSSVPAPPGWDRHDQSARRNAVRAAPTVADRHGELRGNKNDYNDALAIAEAVTRPEMRFSAINTQEQQDIQALHRLRERRIQERTALCNQVRGLLAEYGLIIKVGVRSLQRKLPDLLEDAENGLSDVFRRYLIQIQQQLQELDAHIDFYNDLLQEQNRQNEACQRLQSIPGFGPVVASVFYSMIGNGENYRRGRDVLAAVGLVPKQHSSGGKDRLLGISKRGDRYLRSLLVHGARSVIIQAATKDDRLSRWINRIRAERGYNKATVALANKMARIGWAVIVQKTVYQAA